MQFAMELWMPIVLGGLAVFILSALAWTVMPHHKTEWQRLTNEDAVTDALRAGGISPGLYSFPFAADTKEMNTPEFVAKMNRGPVGFLTVAPSGVFKMGPMMAKSLVYNLVVALFVAYVVSHTVAADAEYLTVYRVAGTVTFMAYAFGTVSDSIWFGKPWKSYGLCVVDALVYGLVTGGIFGWLW